MFIDNENFKKIVSFTPLISIDLIVENSYGHILLGKRTNRPARGFWFVPGGRVLKNETLAEAFERLTKDELGFTFSINKSQFLGIYEHFYEDNFSGKDFSTHYIVIGRRIFLDSELTSLNYIQHSSYEWFSKDDLIISKDVHSNTKAYFL